MASATPGKITRLLARARQGDKAAEQQLLELLQPELDKIASRILSREYHGSSLETHDLVSELYLKLRLDATDFNDRVHFKSYAARLMHHCLIDRARRRIRRGPRENLEDIQNGLVDEGSQRVTARAYELARLGELVNELNRLDARAAQVVVFKQGGMTNEEIAEALGVSLVTVKRTWKSARAFLLSKLG
ncbi:MAG: sigma-70 family RNA polymerase sigma factor [Acidobacteria bacterium]|nr:sigma-70 family RNA polymerase sigma factor [Acidobacteriota bacterium]